MKTPRLILAGWASATLFAALGCAGGAGEPFAPGTQLAVGQPSGPPPPIAGSMASSPSGLTAVRVQVGRREFASGDAVTIQQVYATSSRFAPGDTVIVRGQYQLGSAPTATLALYVTGRGGGGRTRSLPNQRVDVTRGVGDFELSCVVPYPGDLHISFYPTGGGGSFGGVYFSPR